MTDVRREVIGQVEVYLTVVVAAVTAILDMLDIVNPEIVSGATLAVLALLASGRIISHQQGRQTQHLLQALSKEVHRATTDLSGPAPLDETLRRTIPGTWPGDPSKVRDLALIGVTLSRTVRTALPDLEQCLASGGTVRVAIIDPRGNGPQEAASRHGVPAEAAAFDHRLQATIRLLHYLARSTEAGERLQVRFLPFVPTVALTVINLDTPDAEVLVDVYAHRPEACEPSFHVSARHDPQWFAHFLAEYHRIWEAGRPAALPTRPPRSQPCTDLAEK
ncbi:MAG: hypothetical protein QG622_2771 [Actinomycetota bacterium]|nr:hypothetical protein [Actinomycetota bacterium]